MVCGSYKRGSYRTSDSSLSSTLVFGCRTSDSYRELVAEVDTEALVEAFKGAIA